MEKVLKHGTEQTKVNKKFYLEVVEDESEKSEELKEKEEED